MVAVEGEQDVFKGQSKHQKATNLINYWSPTAMISNLDV